MRGGGVEIPLLLFLDGNDPFAVLLFCCFYKLFCFVLFFRLLACGVVRDCRSRYRKAGQWKAPRRGMVLLRHQMGEHGKEYWSVDIFAGLMSVGLINLSNASGVVLKYRQPGWGARLGIRSIQQRLPSRFNH